MVYNSASPGTSNIGPLGPSLAQYCSASAYITFATLLDAYLRSNDKISGIKERIQSVEVPDDVYDFVVVGGGAAGCVVASRLSENPDWKVLLLENGPDESVAAQVPLIYRSLMGTPVDWNYTTTNERYGCLSSNGSCSISAGKMLGGSTAHNAMMYMRGFPKDYNRWAALGNEGWSYEDVLPYFKKSEDNREIDRVGTKYHGVGGLLPVGRLRYIPPFGKSILAASIEAGYGVSEDLNGDQVIGFSLAQTTTKDGVRSSTAKAFLWPFRHRKNLDISLDSTVTRLIIEDGVVVGVEYFKNNETRTINVRKEVIVSAGNIESPKLLLLSGIGPKKDLEAVGVDVVHDLPGVGKNFHDHMTYYVTLTVNDTDIYEYDWDAVNEYLANQTGPLSGTGVMSVSGRVATSLTTPDDPDIRLGFIAYTTSCAPGEVGALRSTGRRSILLSVSNLRPASRGKVSLASNDPLDYPVIWGNYLSDSSDIGRMIQGIELGLALTRTEAMRALDMTMSTTAITACSNYTFASYEYWTCALRQKAGSDIHQAGTCKMGPSSDPTAVVDPQLRVHGIKRLRVADASVMPQVISGNTAAPTMMIGERGADFVKSAWERHSRRKTTNRRNCNRDKHNSRRPVEFVPASSSNLSFG